MDAAVLLGFANVSQGDVTLTRVGRDFATTTILRSKDLFRQQVLERVPMITSMVQTLREKQNGSMRSEFFLDLLDEHFPHTEAERLFATAIDLGHYAELFEYDAGEERLYLPEAVDIFKEECLAITCIRFNSGNTISIMHKVDPTISHNGFASARTRSRMK
ncbi:AAA-associated domain-containing protein [Thermocoleostomius sinensis A174]|uniref:AAA-associated domain-containing protein n=1 Tax=Thermocoleostomius sinensis A174 TaxID=2016057 RepID=A0A9E9C9Q9_9CYAN|nr:AAA-associated domain-containing protein [Thermocoleostomius sinensis A174]